MNRGKTTYINYNQPKKRKTWKVVILVLSLVIVGLIAWIGLTAYQSVKKITGDQGLGGSLFSLLTDKKTHNLKGYSEGRTNILLLGMGGKNHNGGLLSDTIMVLSIDWQTNQVAMMSIPRDLWVPIPNYGKAKINAAYAYGEQDAKKTGGGGKLSSETVSKVINQPIHYYTTIDFNGFKKLVDSLGGIDIYVDKAIYDPYFPAEDMIRYSPFKISTGWHHMDGSTALKYARSRETTSDFDRARRQQEVMLAVKDKFMSLSTISNPLKLTDLLKTLGDNLRTSMNVNEIKELWDSLKDTDKSKIINKVLDTAPDSPLTGFQDERGYIIVPKKGEGNFTEIQRIAKNIFSEQPAVNDYKIEVLNGTVKSGTATQLGQLLTTYGYDITKTGNATKKYPKSVIYNCAGEPADNVVKELSQTLNMPIESKASCGSGEIQIIVGDDFQQQDP